MAKNTPDTIPTQHRKSMFRSECYRDGWRHGHGIACHNVPELGELYRTENLGKVRADSENIREIHADLCYMAESNARCYSPWEFTANLINNSRNPEGGWEAYDAGVYDAISADLSEYTDEDYGFETEPEEEDGEPETDDD